MENTKRYIWSELWFISAVLLFIYFISIDSYGFWASVREIFNLFVPYGIFNYFAVFDVSDNGFIIRIIVLLGFIFLMFYNNKMLKSLEKKPVLKLIVNLVILFFYTGLVDMVSWGGWCSLREFLDMSGSCDGNPIVLR